MQNTHKHIIKYKKYRNIGLLFTVDANSYKFFYYTKYLWENKN